KDIKDYLPFYVRSKIRFDGTNQELLRIHGITDGSVRTLTPALLHTAFVWSDHVKLILRRLSDMSEEENQEWAETNGALGNCSRYEDEANATVYLLSKGFDLFGLIDSGLAIDAKTLTN